jgi:hypothetical protein
MAAFLPPVMTRRILISFLFAVLAFGVPLFAAGGGSPALNAAMTSAINTLDHDASKDAESPMLVADLIQKEYGTREEELKWALGQKLSWGEITALAYIQATTGKTFAEMNGENAQHDFWSYAENAGMNCEKMTRSLGAFLKRVERERNSRIFDRLRASRRVHPLPDLGSGFGLFQEALDFRRIDSPHGPTKIHDFPGELAKGGK